MRQQQSVPRCLLASSRASERTSRFGLTLTSTSWQPVLAATLPGAWNRPGWQSRRLRDRRWRPQGRVLLPERRYQIHTKSHLDRSRAPCALFQCYLCRLCAQLIIGNCYRLSTEYKPAHSRTSTTRRISTSARTVLVPRTTGAMATRPAKRCVRILWR